MGNWLANTGESDPVDGSEIQRTSSFLQFSTVIYVVLYIQKVVGLGISEASTVWGNKFRSEPSSNSKS